MRNRLGSFLVNHPRRIAAGVVAVVVGVLLAGVLVVPVSLGARATGPPRLVEVSQAIFSTRAQIGVELKDEFLATKWKASYGSSPTGPWTEVNAGEISQEAAANSEGERVEIGTHDRLLNGGASEEVFLRGLKTGTSYYARFIAENADNSGKPAEDVIPFETLPVEKPEVDRINFGATSFQQADELTDTTTGFYAKIDANGAAASYAFEYALSEAGPWSQGATGTIGASEEYKWVQAGLSGLKPETKYYVRLKASNEKGETVQRTYNKNAGEEVSSFTTGTAKPDVSVGVRNVTAASAYVHTLVGGHGSATHWGLEYAESEGGPWSPVPGGSGTVSQVQAEALGYDAGAQGGVRLTGLSASSTYYVRASASNSCAEGCGSVTSGVSSFTTSGGPSASVFGAHGLVGDSLRLLGSVASNSVATSAEQVITLEGSPTGGSFTLSFEGHSTAALPYDASAGEVQQALDAEVGVEGPDGGPYTLIFYAASSGQSEPLIEGDGSGLTPSGSVSVVSTQAGGVGYDTHYHFEYVSERSFAEHVWAQAVQSPEEDAGLGETVGYDLPALTGGETYRYRLIAQSDAPGTGPVESAEATLTVPVPASVGSESCPNEAFRTGESAHLPDCRAYEMLTPAEKEGAQELYHYGAFSTSNQVLVGEDGEHLLLEAYVTAYRKGPFAGQSPYLFSREPGAWSMIAGLAQPEAGVYRYTPQVYSSDLTQMALVSEYQTSGASKSADVEYKLGPVGGRYSTVVSVPRQYEEAGLSGAGWVAGDPSLSKLVLETPDHELLGEETGTKSGSDLYEYTLSGGLAQLNVTEPGVTIGSCGAQIVRGSENGESEQVGTASSQHSVSADGSRVFFEADPGKKCGLEPANLYMRVNGSETVTIGAYAFLAANAEGTQLLLRSDSTGEAVLYDTESQVPTPLPQSSGMRPTDGLVVSSDLTDAYYGENGLLHRYDIQAGVNEALFQASSSGGHFELSVTPDGRFVYFKGAVAGLPGNGTYKEGPEKGETAEQLYRYDSEEHVVECVSCASSFDPEPREPAFLNTSTSRPQINGGVQLDSSVSGDGDYAFFTTPAALVSEDNDGELSPESVSDHTGGLENGEYEDVGQQTSPSSDIYEWRANGVHGCAQLSGCVALITAGHGGLESLLLGSADEGQDVFIYTHEKLVPQDQDVSGNIYDVRVDGGSPPPPPRPTECEGDACSAPPSPPNDVTPASLTFTGVGNVLPVITPAPSTVKAKAKKTKVKKKKSKLRKKRKKSNKRTKKSTKGSR
jgi:hypothetical protein